MRRDDNVDLGRITSERLILNYHLEAGLPLKTAIAELTTPTTTVAQPGQDELGLYRSRESRKAVIADTEFLRTWIEKGLDVPAFLEAGPRRELHFNPRTVRAAIVTTGGLAPGLHCVIHSIVKRHCQTYRLNDQGRVYGVYNSFKGLSNFADNRIQLDPGITEEWLYHGGSKLGIVRYDPPGMPRGPESITRMATDITRNLELSEIDILYVIGGDGTMRAAHEIARLNPTRSIVGIPKTMDNDILWVWQSFGFDTAVEQARHVINTLRSEAEATRRIGLIVLFGAESGFVAANAALASGHVDSVLIPEVVKALDRAQAEAYITDVVKHLSRRIRRDRPHNPHAVVVIAEGVEKYLASMGASILGRQVEKSNFVPLLSSLIDSEITDVKNDKVDVFVNEPRHYIRSIPANAHDQIYCERLGALAVDNALAGYTDCMVSQWLTEFVLVPIDLVTRGQKGIPVNGMFWKQVVSSTGQPLSPAERVA